VFFDIVIHSHRAAAAAAKKIEAILQKRNTSAKRPAEKEEIPIAPTHPLAPGTEVAAKLQGEDSDWILASVQRWDAGRRRYDVVDVDEDAEGSAEESRYV